MDLLQYCQQLEYTQTQHPSIFFSNYHFDQIDYVIWVWSYMGEK